jgi:uncharacterized protein (DUF885 family)
VTSPPPAAVLAALADRLWTAAMDADPLTGTLAGESRYDALLPDITPAGRDRADRELADLRRQVEAVPVAGLSAGERIDRSVLLSFVDTELAQRLPQRADWSVDPMLGPQLALPTMATYQPVDEPARAAAALERWRGMAPYVDQYAANLRAAGAAGRRPAAVLVRRVLAQLDDLLARPLPDSPLLQPAREDRPLWTDAERDRFDGTLADVVRDTVLPAFARLRVVLAEEVLPTARPDDRAGLGDLPDGDALYRQAIRGFATVELTAEEVHAAGLREVARNDDQLLELGGRSLGPQSLPELLDRLRRPEFGYDTPDELVEAARTAVRRAEEAVPDWFGLRHAEPCAVGPTPRHEEADSPPAQYLPANGDGSRPGRFYVNTGSLADRSRFLVEVQAFHEAVPGHHLQWEVARRLDGLPAIRRQSVPPAFSEGWGLYAETLAEDMGLYSSDLDRMGARSFDALRSCRLVVDSGLHALGWSRQRAVDYLRAHTTLPERAAEAEIDRYLAWPGQALGYKLGQLEILALRAEARQRQGGAYDVRRFHDAVLGQGGLPLGTLREVVTAALP